MTAFDKAQRQLERANGFHRMVFEYAREQSKKLGLEALPHEWLFFAYAIHEATQELFAGERKRQEEIIHDFPEHVRAQEADFAIKESKEQRA